MQVKEQQEDVQQKWQEVARQNSEQLVGAFETGHKKVGGRAKGTRNKATVAWKQFVTDLCEDPEVQRSTKESILNGKTELIFKAAEHAFGKPTETVKVQGEFRMIEWPDNEDVQE